MATIMDLFSKNRKDLYGGTSGELYQKSQGLVNLPRAAALVASSPSAVADLIGNQIGGIMKGSANRPSDTIFKNNKPFTKPVTFLTNAKNAVDDDTYYYVKKKPAPASIFAKLKQGATSPAGLVTRGALNVAKNPLKAAKAIKNIASSLKKTVGGETTNTYGTKYSQAPDGTVLKSNRKFSKYAPVYGKTSKGYRRISTEERDKSANTFDELLNSILENKLQDNGKDFAIEKDNIHNAPYVMFALYPNRDKKILLPATISGLSEDMAPDVESFQYLGSPFKSYRYHGVERSIKFSLKLYYTDIVSKKAMIANLNRLRKLVYPTDKLSNITYEGSTEYAITSFSPNLVYLTIYGLYREVFGIIDNLSFSIDDNIPWATTDSTNESAFNGKSKEKPYPSVIDVSLSMKVFETPRAWGDGLGGTEWEYADDYASTYFTSNAEEDRKATEAAAKQKIEDRNRQRAEEAAAAEALRDQQEIILDIDED